MVFWMRQQQKYTKQQCILMCIWSIPWILPTRLCVCVAGPTQKRSVTRIEKSEKNEKRTICYRKVGDAILSHIHFVLFLLLELWRVQWRKKKYYTKESVCVYPVLGPMIVNQVIWPNRCVSPSNVRHHDHQCWVHYPNWKALYLCWTDAKSGEKSRRVLRWMKWLGPHSLGLLVYKI